MKKLKTFLFLMTFLFSGVYLLAMKSKKPKSIPKTESIEVLPYDCLAEIVAFLALPERLLCRHLSIRFYVVFMNYDHSDLTIRRDDIKKGTEEDFLKFFVKNRTNHKNIGETMACVFFPVSTIGILKI